MRPGKRGAARINPAALRELLADGRIHTALGVVTKFPGEVSHFEILADDVLVDVELVPNGERVACRLGLGSGGGVWKIPAVGTEVGVLVPMGDLEADPIITCALSTGVVPSQLSSDQDVVIVAAGKATVIAPTVQLGDNVGLSKVAMQSDLQTLLNAITSAVAVAGDGGANLKSTILSALSTAGFPVCATRVSAK